MLNTLITEYLEIQIDQDSNLNINKMFIHSRDLSKELSYDTPFHCKGSDVHSRLGCKMCLSVLANII